MSTSSPNDTTITPGNGSQSATVEHTEEYALEKNPRLSVIVPTSKRPKELWAVVNQLLHQQNFTDFELLVIDQSPDETPVPNDPRVRYSHIKPCGPLAGINEGISRAHGEIILILNDDVVLDGPGFLDAHLTYYQNPTVGGVGGRVVDRVLKPNTRQCQCKIGLGGRTIENLTGTRPRWLHSVPGANMSFRAQVLRELGGFDTGYTGTALLGETDFATRVRKAGLRLVFAPDAGLLHLAAPRGGTRTDPLSLQHSRFRNTGYYVMRHRGPLGLVPFVLTFSLIAMKIAWHWRRPTVIPALWRAMRDGIRASRRWDFQGHFTAEVESRVKS